MKVDVVVVYVPRYRRGHEKHFVPPLTGIHLAGPNLTPATFRDGLYRFPPSGGVATLPLLSWGENIALLEQRQDKIAALEAERDELQNIVTQLDPDNVGPDGKPDTKDDLPIGPVDAIWSIEEYTATFDDDDLKFVGEVDAKTGLFNPALDGPNPKRSGNRNNIGDVWVVATHRPTPDAAPMRARAHLVVTVPLYLRWDFSSMVNR